jgi:hypothetical protein
MEASISTLSKILKSSEKIHILLVKYIVPFVAVVLIYFSLNPTDQTFIAGYNDLLQTTMQYIYSPNIYFSWNNFWITGFPEYASPLIDRFYPFSYPFYLITKDIFVMNFVILFHLFIAYLAFYKLGSLSIRNSDILMIFSLFYIFSGTMVARLVGGAVFYIFAFAWLPLGYYFFFKIASNEQKNVWDYFFFIICFLFIYLTGVFYIFTLAYSLIIIMTLSLIVTKKINMRSLIALIATTIVLFLLAAIRLIPSLVISDKIIRIDPINPLAGGGVFESSLSAFMFGTQIDTFYGNYESVALIGAIVVLLAIIALIWGQDQVIIPCFGAIIFAFLWADGGETLLSFIHLFPVYNGFRCPGRIFGAIMPIVLFLSAYGFEICIDKMQNGKNFIVAESERKRIKWAVITILILKVCELLFQQIPSVESFVSLLLVGIILGLCYFDKATIQNFKILISAAFILELIFVLKNYHTVMPPFIVSGLIILAIVTAIIVVWKNNILKNQDTRYFTAILLMGLILMIIVNASTLSLSDPGLEKSSAIPIIEKIKEYPSTTPQIWVYEIGWPYKHMDFTYLMIKNHIHPIRAYYAYFNGNMPPLFLKIGNIDYYTADYIIDTAYLENGNQNLPDVTFKVDNISVYKPDHVLPNAFVIRNGQMIPATIETFSPDEVKISGSFLQGDIAVLKTAFYPGWKINNRDASNLGNMVGADLSSDTSTIIFKFDPLDLKIGAIFSVIGIIALLLLIIKRREFDNYLNGINKSVMIKKPHHGRKPDK